MRRLSSFFEPMITKRVKTEIPSKPSGPKLQDQIAFQEFEKSISMPIELPRIQKSHSFSQDKAKTNNSLTTTSKLLDDLATWDKDDTVS